jgi:outer membrane cobalamin receptor
MPTYSIINTTIDYNFSISKYQTIIGFLVNNITDTRFQSVYGYPELGRSIEFQIKIKKRKKNEKIL